MATAAQKHATFKSEYMTVTLEWDDQVGGRPPVLVQAAMTSISSELLERSKSRAPRRSGRLVDDTGVVTNAAGDTWRIQYRQPYARRQHYHHPTGGRPSPGRRTIRGFSESSIPSKKLWLMTTVREEMDSIDRDIAARVSRASAHI
jgi:predicted nucleic acid-binding Zn ribbon protein